MSLIYEMVFEKMAELPSLFELNKVSSKSITWYEAMRIKLKFDHELLDGLMDIRAKTNNSDIATIFYLDATKPLRDATSSIDLSILRTPV